LGITANSE